ncbi:MULTISPECIES: class III lanthipeptide [Niallia]|nr:class III lanthipeptide [Niallia circulans]
MKNVLGLQKLDKRERKENPLKSSVSLGCSPSSNTSWFFC